MKIDVYFIKEHKVAVLHKARTRLLLLINYHFLKLSMEVYNLNFLFFSQQKPVLSVN